MQKELLMTIGLFLAGVMAEAAPITFEVEVTARGACRDRIAQVSMDLAQMRQFLYAGTPAGEWDAHVVDLETGETALSQTDLDLNDGGNAVRGTVSWLIAGRSPNGTVRRYRVTLGLPRQAQPAQSITVECTDQEIVVRTPNFLARHALGAGGTLAHVSFGGEAERTLPLRMNDRVYDRKLGGFSLRCDPSPDVEVVAAGPLLVLVRTMARYCDRRGKRPPGEPWATYTFAYDAFSPTVKMTAQVRQQSGPAWSELHVFEMHHKAPHFRQLAMSPPLQTRTLIDEKRTHSLRGRDWGALLNDRDALALIGPGLYGIHTNVSGYGAYVHGPWRRFGGGEQTFEATLYLGPSGGSAEELAKRVETFGGEWEVRVRVPQMQARVVEVRNALTQLQPKIKALPSERRAAVERLASVARWLTDRANAEAGSLSALDQWQRSVEAARAVAETATRFTEGKPGEAKLPLAYADEHNVILAGDGVALRFTRNGQGMGLAQVAHLESQSDFLARGRTLTDLWSLTFQHTETKELATVLPACAAATTWEARTEGDAASLQMTWERCTVGDAVGALDVVVAVSAANDSGLTRWRLRLNNRSERYGLWEIRFPRIASIGPRGYVCVPRKWGTVYEVPLAGSGYRARYPSGGAFGQLVCYWREQSGLYLGAHDGAAGVKELSVTADGADCVRYELNTFPGDMGVPKPKRDLGYDVAVGAFRGDWFEAAKIYRQWAIRQFWCRKGPIVSRDDMPQWFKECALCFRPGGVPAKVGPMLERLAAAFEMPAVCHWYSWHQIPFDNDYPEYFPVRPGFKEAVAQAQAVGARIMPYINGHLWDTDTKSWQVENGRSAAALRPDGGLYIERWSKQEHAAMCPHTQLWKRKMREIAVRLVGEYRVKGLYLDQIGAASPRLCFARDHGHPLGGGDFWSRGYDELLAELRAAAHAIDPDFIMTTESHAEPYLAQLDGHLMCNLVGADQVPLYAAIYAGYTQTFGRHGEVGNPAAFAMEHGQAFAFGSMMGRVNSEALLQPDKARLLAYLESLARLRRDYRDFMAFGEMLRPPCLGGGIPTVSAQWKSKTRDHVRMPAIQCSAWRAPDGRIGLFFTNVADETVAFAHEFVPHAYDLPIDAAMSVATERSSGERNQAQTRGREVMLKYRLKPQETIAIIVATD